MQNKLVFLETCRNFWFLLILLRLWHTYDYNYYTKTITIGYALGRLRDVTIDYRESGYFRLDPTVHPQEDGVTVFLLTLESDGVMTLVPDEKKMHRISDIEQISNNSWTLEDMDILHKRGDLVCLTEKARHELSYGIRQGIDADIEKLKVVRKKQMLKKQEMDDMDENENENERENDGKEGKNKMFRQAIRQQLNKIRQEEDETINYENVFIAGNLDSLEQYNQSFEMYCLCDWWGTKSNILPRCKEKIMISLSFARPT